MEFVFSWLEANWLQFLQGFGIIGGLIFTGCSFRLNAKAQRVQTLINLTQQHRTIWLKYSESPKLKGIFSSSPRSKRDPTEEERLFVNLIFLHLSSTLAAVRARIIPKPEGLAVDFSEIMQHPIPQKVWERSKHYHDRQTQRFIENAMKTEQESTEH